MNVSYNQLDNVSGEIAVTIEQKDYNEKVEKQLKEISKHRPEPGFRPGHTPMGLLRKKYGQAVKYDVINKEVADAIYDYIRDENLQVLGNPVPIKNDDFNLDDADFTFKFKVGIAPVIDPKVDKDMHIPYYEIKVSEEMIDNEDKNFRNRFGRQEPGPEVEPNALVKGEIVELDSDGQPKEGGIVVENGIVAPSYFKDKAQEALFEGKKVGDSVVFNPAATCEGNTTELSSMLNIDKENVNEHFGDFSMNIKEIIVLKPAELNEEYYDNLFGKDRVHNEEEYRDALKEMIASSLRNDSFYRFTIDAKEGVEKSVGDIELPVEILKDYLINNNEDVTAENVDETFASMKPQLEWELISTGIAKKFDLKVEEADILNIAKQSARQQLAQYGMANVPEETLEGYAKKILEDEKARRQFSAQALDFKIFNAIRENVTLDNKEVTVEEFRELFTPQIGEQE